MRAIFGLGSILMVVLILGILSASSLGSNSGAPTSTVATGSGPTTTVSPTSRAAVAACEADANEILTAVGAYDAVNLTGVSTETVGTAPGDLRPGVPASYATATNAERLVRGSYLSSWPGDPPAFALSLSTETPGEVVIYVPATARSGTAYADETATTGCHAL